MRRSGPAWLLGAVAGLAWTGTAAADETVRGAGVDRTIDCGGAGGEVTISGSGHNLRLTGRCTRVVLSGTGSVVHVEELGRLTVSGVNQRVEWVKGLDGAEPTIRKSGVGNQVVRVATGAATARRSGGSRGSVETGAAGTTVEAGGSKVTIGSDGGVTVDSGGTTTTATTSRSRDKDKVTVKAGSATVAVDSGTGTVTVGGTGATTVIKAGSITVVENDQQRTHDCAGGSASIQGNDNVLTLRNCPELTVTGSRNSLTLQGGVRLIRALGDNNEITWSQGVDGRSPNVESLGSGNNVKRSGR